MNSFFLNLAELGVNIPRISLSEIATLLTIGGSLGGLSVWLFGTKFVSKITYDKDREATLKQIAACDQSLLLAQQSAESLKDAVRQLTTSIQENTAAVHSLDKRLAIVESHQPKG